MSRWASTLPTNAPMTPANSTAHCGSPASAAATKKTTVTAAPKPQRTTRLPSILK
jgi:hypothetical protein